MWRECGEAPIVFLYYMYSKVIYMTVQKRSIYLLYQTCSPSDGSEYYILTLYRLYVHRLIL